MRSFAKGSFVNDLQFEVKVKGQGHLKNHENKVFSVFFSLFKSFKIKSNVFLGRLTCNKCKTGSCLSKIVFTDVFRRFWAI